MTVFLLTLLVLWASVARASVVLASDHTSYREVNQFLRKLMRSEDLISMPSGTEKQLSTSPLKQLLNNDIHDTDPLIPDKRQMPETLSAWLTEMHMMNELMHQLRSSDRKQLVDLLYAVQHGQLTQYLKNIGYRAVFVILSHVSRQQSLDLEHLLEKHLQKEAAIAKATAANTKTTAQPATQKPTLRLTTITM